MKRNMIILGLIASTGLTFYQVPKATAWNLRLSNEVGIEDSQKISYTGTNEDGEEENVDTEKKN